VQPIVAPIPARGTVLKTLIGGNTGDGTDVSIPARGTVLKTRPVISFL